MGIDEVGIDKVGIDEVGRYHVFFAASRYQRMEAGHTVNNLCALNDIPGARTVDTHATRSALWAKS